MLPCTMQNWGLRQHSEVTQASPVHLLPALGTPGIMEPRNELEEHLPGEASQVPQA